MIDYIVGAVLGILIGAAIAYIIREKKRGNMASFYSQMKNNQGKK